MEDTIIDTTTCNRRPEVAVLLPCYNEADVIEKVVREFHEEMNGKIPFEIVVCEDGSTDGTKDVLRKLSKELPMKAVLGFERKGYLRGLKDGLNLVEAKYVFFADADGQHIASDFWKLFGLKEKYDIVSGWRVNRADNSFRRIISRSFQFMTRIVFGLPNFKDATAPFKLMRTEVGRAVAKECAYLDSFWTEFTIRAYKKTFKIREVPVTHRNRLNGTTRVYRLSKMPKIMLAHVKGLLGIRRTLVAES